MTIPHLAAPHLTFDTNMIMVIVLVMVLLYGLVMGHAKLKTFALSCFVGLVMVLTFSDSVANLLQRANWGSHLGLTGIKVALFALPVVILEFANRKEKGKHGAGMLLTLILAVVTSALVISSILSFLDSASVSSVLQESVVANWIYTFRWVWLVAVPVAIIAERFMPKEKH